jgi:uncharacterized protein (DUF1800 family)
MGKIKRREFFEELIAIQQETPKQNSEDQVFKKFANKITPASASKTTATSLNQYTGPWTNTEVLHLLRRTTFGIKAADVTALKNMTMTQAVDLLLNVSATPPAPPVNNYNNSYADPNVPAGQTWVTAPYDANAAGYRVYSLKSWWLGLMINENLSILEKMTLFWHNHFATEILTVSDARLSYKYLALLRSMALGNFKTLTRQITTDPAMLKYLNGYLNTKTAPDENYARELQELFTVSKDSQTTYSEDDVKAAAKVLTGWRINSSTLSSYFDSTKHDTTNKQFSVFYGNTVITGKSGASGATETDDLINMIFNKGETALHICRKLYRFFVYYVIDANVETNIIIPLAQQLVMNNYNIKPVLDTLLKSEHFYDINSEGCYIRSPLDFLAGTFRTFDIQLPVNFTVDKTYAIWNYIRNYGSTLTQDVGDPPNVAGWPAFRQDPEYYELWINSTTLPGRLEFSDMMLNSGFSAGTGTAIKIDLPAFAKLCSNPYDPNTLMDFCVDMLLGIPISSTSKSNLKISYLLSGQLTDSYWSSAWVNYVSNPNTANTNIIKSRLLGLMTELTHMAEHQLC